MENLIFIMLAPWLVFIVLAIIACWLLKQAEKHKGIAFAFGVFVQMFSPDPMVEYTIKIVQIDKQVIKQKQKQKLKKKEKEVASK